MRRRDVRDLEWTRPGRLAWLAVLALWAGLSSASPAAAQGFGIYEQGACAMGRAGAAVAAPCPDGSSLFFNPAAVADAENLTLALGGLGIYPDGGFTSDLTGRITPMADEAIPLGHFYATFPLWTHLAGGIGIYAPYGLETRWPKDFSGRFVGYDSKLQSLYVQGTLAASLTDWLSVGGGPLIALSSVQLNRRLDLANQPASALSGAPAGSTLGELGVPPGTDFVDATLDSDEATGYGANVGLLLRPYETLRLGVRYLSKVTIDYEGFAGFSQVETGLLLPPNNPLGLPGGSSVDSLLEAEGLFLSGGPFSGQEAAATLDLPAQLVVGGSVEPVDGLLLAADLQRTFWSTVDRVRLDFANDSTPDDALVFGYRDTNTLRLGVEYRVLPALSLRAGYIHNEAAAPASSVTPILPEGARNHVSAGLGWEPTDQIRLDLAYQYLAQEDRRGRVRNPPPSEDPTPSLNGGEYRFDGQLLSATLSWRFR